MTKEEIIQVVSLCSKLYCENLLNKNLLFICERTKIECVETKFNKNNFLHLTGLVMTKNNTAAAFFDKCKSSRLKSSDFEINTSGNTALKLRVLPQLMSIHNKARMLGEYNSSKPLLMTEKLLGNVGACLGFVCDSDNYFVPNTALQEDVRNISKVPQKRVVAVLRKDINNNKYEELCYLAKGIVFSEIKIPREMICKIDPALLGSNNTYKSELKATPAYQQALEKFGQSQADKMVNELINKPKHQPIKNSKKGKDNTRSK